MKTLIDANILVYARDSGSSYQKVAAKLVREALEGRIEAVIVSDFKKFSFLETISPLKKP